MQLKAEPILIVGFGTNNSKLQIGMHSPPGAPIQIRKWGDNYGEQSEPKKIFLLAGEIIHPETAKLTMLE
jgi:hypothetical protein